MAALLDSYQSKLQIVGAPAKEIVTQLDKREKGSVSIRVRDPRGAVRNTMTAKDASGRLVPHGIKPGLIMYAEEKGDKKLEVPDK